MPTESSPKSGAINCTHVKTPCPDCPFSRSVRPGALGGSPATTFIGQAYGPFILPCHKHCDFNDPQWKAKTINTPQCAGAAIFRANVGVAPLLPDAIHKLPANHEAVFSTAAEFLSHHMMLPLEYAQEVLSTLTPAELCKQQMGRSTNMTFEV